MQQPFNVRSAHQSMHHLVADADWSDQQLLGTVAQQVLPTLMQQSKPYVCRIRSCPRSASQEMLRRRIPRLDAHKNPN